jgi:hypothetical protein
MKFCYYIPVITMTLPLRDVKSSVLMVNSLISFFLCILMIEVNIYYSRNCRIKMKRVKLNNVSGIL